MELGRVRVSYTAAQDGARQTIETRVQARFSTSDTEVAASRDNAVIESVVEQSVRARTAAAIELRDKGRHGEAQALFSAEREGDREPGRRGAAVGPAAISQAAIRGIVAAPPASPTAQGGTAQVPAADGLEPGGAGLTVLSGRDAARRRPAV